jgi:hypothetical protein
VNGERVRAPLVLVKSSMLNTGRPVMVALLGGRCWKCGRRDNLHIHHKDRDRRNNDLANLELLCVKHHARWHRGCEGSATMPEDIRTRLDPLRCQEDFDIFLKQMEMSFPFV